jgi:hypothetical protein
MIARSDNVERRFMNQYGEEWRLQIDVADQTGLLSGDELGDDVLEIIDDELVDSDLILSKPEIEWLDSTWRDVFGRPFRPSLFNRLMVIGDVSPNEVLGLLHRPQDQDRET